MKWLGPTWIAVDLSAITNNLTQIRNLTTAKLCAVLKGEAYGHGIGVVSLLLEQAKVSYLAVNDLQEALEIRSYNVKTPILILTPSLPQEMNEISNHDLTITISSFEQLTALTQQIPILRKPIKVHLKVDTGMHRIGIKPEDTLSCIELIHRHSFLKLEGIYTHFSSANSNSQYMHKQFQQFSSLKQEIIKHQNPNILWHCANSSAFINLASSHLDMVRIGTLLFGQSLNPLPPSLQLNSTWQLYSRFIQIQSIPKGEPIGYDQTFTTKRNTIIGVLPIGYGDGLGVEPAKSVRNQFRNSLVNLIDNPHKIYLNDQVFPIIGKISMGMCCVDLTNHPDPYSLYGAIVEIPARRTTINRRLPKVYSQNNRLLLIDWQHKLWRAFVRNKRIYLKEANSTLAREIILGGM